MTGRVSGKVVVVTGAASGLGEATARLMHAEGATVLLTDIQDERGKRVVGEMGGRSRYLHCDVTAEPDVAYVVDTAVRDFGRLDCMFNNAARPDRRRGRHCARRFVAGERRRRVRQRPDPGRRRWPDNRVEGERRPGRARPVGEPARPGP